MKKLSSVIISLFLTLSLCAQEKIVLRLMGDSTMADKDLSYENRWVSLQSKGLSRLFSNTTVQKHQFFGAQLSSQSTHYNYRPFKHTLSAPNGSPNSLQNQTL